MFLQHLPKKKPVIITLIIFVIISGFLGYFFFSRDVGEASAWWNEGWHYRKLIPITNGGSTLTDYQVAFTLDTASLISAGKMQADCDDLRITDYQGQVLPYWLEENNPGCNNAATKVWTKVASLPNGTTNIFTYYGNPQATNAQKGSEVFTFFDDFSGSVVDSSKWTNHSGCAATISSGVMQIGASPTCDATPLYANLSNLSDASGYIMEFRGKFSSGGSGRLQVYQRYRISNGYLSRFWTSGTATTNFQEYSGSWTGNTNIGANNMSADTWYNLKTQVNGSNNTFFINDASIGSGTSSGSLSPLSDLSIALGQYQTVVQYDNVRLRKYTATEPTIGTLGSEEKGEGPVGYWRFDEGYGTSTADSTTYLNNASINGATWLNQDQCISGRCFSFDGTNDYVSVPDANQIDFTNGITMSAWVKLNSYTMGGANTDRGAITIKASAYYMSVTAGTGKLASFFYGVDANHRDSNTAIPLNQWTHVAITWDGSNIKWYLNGVLDKTYAATGTITTNGNALNIGMESAGYGRALNGFIDEVKFYNYGRNETQIKQDYTAGLAGSGASAGASAVLGGKSQKWLADGLVGYWKMDEASWNGTAGEVVDSSGNGNNGTANGGMTTSTAKYGKGALLDGTDDYISCGTSSNFIFGSNSHTFSAWVKGTSFTNSYNYIFSVGDNVTGQQSGFGITSGGNLFHSAYSSPLVTFTNTISTGNWYHVVLVHKDGISYVYVNGELKNQQNITMNVATGKCYIGSHTGASSFFNNGSMDDVRVYNRALSGQEVADLYSWAPGPVGYWKFDENTGSTAYDSSGNGFNSTSFSGSPTWKPGKHGSALDFTGTNKYVALPAMTGKYGSALTVSAWVYHTASSNWDDIVAGGCADILFGFSNNQLNFGSQCNSPVTMLAYATNINDAWHYVTGTYDGATSRLYVDGIQVASGSKSGSFTAAAGLAISRSSEDFQGKIDEVKIYNYVRTPKQIQEDMGTGIGGPVNWWRFDEGQGTTAYNNVVGGPNGTITGGTWTTSGKISKAISFNGTTTKVNISQPLGNTVPSQLTISTWFKRTRTGVVEYVVDSDGDESTIYIKADNKIRCEYWNGTVSPSVDSNTTITDTNWHHTACVLDYGNQLRVYLDGKLDNTNNSPSGALGNGILTNSNIGARNTTNFFSGLIDDVKMYTYALTDADVVRDYNQGSAIALGSGVESGSTGNAPVAWWKMDDNTGTSAVDSSGSGGTGTLINGPTWKPGKYGSAVSFDGSNDYINVGNTLGTLTEGTISVWFKRRTSTPTYQMIFTDNGSQFEVCYNNNTLQFYVNNAVVSTGSANNTNWQHVEGVFSETGNYQNLYLNGNLVASSTYPGDATAAVRYIGSRAGSFPFDGLVDDVKIYNYARNQAQVSYDYNRGKPVGHWALDEGDGTTARDFSGNGNNGTITIGATGTQTTVAQAWSNGASGKFGKSLNFDGTDDQIIASNALTLKSKTGTFSYWLNLAASDRNHGLFHFYENSTADYIRSYISSGNVIDLVIEDDDVAKVNLNYDLDNLGTFTNQWLHIAWVQDGVGVKLYINGKEVTVTGTNSGDWWSDHLISGYQWRIGLAWYYLQGKIDDFRVYNYGLTAEQVKQVMQEASAVRF
ncbi:DUF2341 domain-containing protein [Patescibacteria group bacterium]|nr:DUF2341 domain-containing protein [Patescibacteria group bacterium]